jgi:hypothetical protein
MLALLSLAWRPGRGAELDPAPWCASRYTRPDNDAMKEEPCPEPFPSDPAAS